MRITESSMATRYMDSINKTRERIVNLQSQTAAGKRVLKVSDDPQGTALIMHLKSLIAANEQYISNTQEAQTFMETTTTTLDQISDVLISLKEVSTRATNGSLSDEYDSFAIQVDEYLDELVNLANTKSNSRYIFSGTNILEQPFTLAADRSSVTVNPNGITGTASIPISEGLQQDGNIDGQEALQGSAIFDLVIRIRDSLKAGSPPDSSDVDQLDTMLNHVLTQSSKAGLMAQQLTNHLSYLEGQNTSLKSLLSNVQDTDVAESVTQLQENQLMLQAALNITAQILPKTLLDYLD
ncbi:MAG: flagellar hook-associated protein FlgL [Bacteroidetes bacterium]|nr:flagellar hook-associated protein FlgL [Bacteroidota bacterium]